MTHTASRRRRHCREMEQSLFDYLERDLVAHSPAQVVRDPLVHAAELANDEWTEDEACEELAIVTEVDALRSAYARLCATLAGEPALDVRGVRTARILRRALDRLDPPPLPPVIATPPRRRGWRRVWR